MYLVFQREWSACVTWGGCAGGSCQDPVLCRDRLRRLGSCLDPATCREKAAKYSGFCPHSSTVCCIGEHDYQILYIWKARIPYSIISYVSTRQQSPATSSNTGGLAGSNHNGTGKDSSPPRWVGGKFGKTIPLTLWYGLLLWQIKVEFLRLLVYVQFTYSIGCAVSTNLFLFASYSHVSVYSVYFFTSFASYSLKKIRTHSHTNIRFDAKNTCCSEYSLQKEYSLKIFLYWRIFASKYSVRSEYSQHFRRISHSSKFLLINIRMQQIFAWKYSHTSECS